MKPIFINLPVEVLYVDEDKVVEAEKMGMDAPIPENKTEEVWINIHQITAIAAEGRDNDETAIFTVDSPIWRVKLSLSQVMKELESLDYPYGI